MEEERVKHKTICEDNIIVFDVRGTTIKTYESTIKFCNKMFGKYFELSTIVTVVGVLVILFIIAVLIVICINLKRPKIDIDRKRFRLL